MDRVRDVRVQVGNINRPVIFSLSETSPETGIRRAVVNGRLMFGFEPI